MFFYLLFTLALLFRVNVYKLVGWSYVFSQRVRFFVSRAGRRFRFTWIREWCNSSLACSSPNYA
jgi:hypothetical protein